MEEQTEITQPEIPIKEKPTSAIPIDQTTKSLAPRDASELTRFLSHISEGGAFPSRFDTAAKKMAAYSLANQLMPGKWQLCLNNIACIKEQMTIYGELPGAIAEQTREVEEKRVVIIDKDYNEISAMNKNLSAEPWAAVCLIQRKGRQPKEFFYTVDEAKKAGQLPAGPHSPWTKHLKIMLYRKAMAQAIKFEFPDAMVGTPVAEYDHDLAPDLSDERSVNSVADDLNSTYLDREG